MLLAALFTYAAGPSQAQTSVSGTVTLQGWLGAPQPLTFTFQTTDAATAFTRSLTPAPDGTFTLSGIPAGRYNLFIKGAKWLQKSVPADTTAGDAAGLSAALPPGDIDGDNQVTLADYLILSAAYNSAPDRGNWNPAADLNGDGRVSLADYLLLSAQYNKAGDFPLPPAAPTGLSATPAEGAVVLAWDSSPSALAYNVYRSTVSGSGYVKVNAAPVTGAGYTDTGLTDGTTYYYVVTATVSYSESAYSGEVSATPNLPAPTDLAAYATGSGKITLYWSASPARPATTCIGGRRRASRTTTAPLTGTRPSRPRTPAPASPTCSCSPTRA